MAGPEQSPKGITQAFLANWQWLLLSLLLSLRFLTIEFNPLVSFLLLFAGAILLLTQAYMAPKPLASGKLAEIAKKVKKFSEGYIIYAIIIGSLALYLFTKSPIFGVVVGLGIIILVLSEVVTGLFTGGLKKEMRETLVSLFLALTIWYGAAFILGTPAPVNGIVSCSMLPHLERGDFTILQGGPVSAPSISMSKAEFGSITQDALVSYGNKTLEVKGSMFAYCINKLSEDRSDALCTDFVYFPEKFSETKGPLKFQYAACTRIYPSSGKQTVAPCIGYVEYKGRKIYENLSNDVVVYQPGPTDVSRRVGDIIHRAYLRIDVEGKDYYLIKGDNNPIFDLQQHVYSLNEGNSPVSEQQLKGKVIFRVPILGYAKLFISGMYVEPEGCDSYYLKYKT